VNHRDLHHVAQRLAVLVAGAGLLAACVEAERADSGELRLADREAIEHVLARANLAFELSDPDLFATAFAADAVYELASDVPVFGYQKLLYSGRDDIFDNNGSIWAIVDIN
jgi:hypothetical protein